MRRLLLAATILLAGCGGSATGTTGSRSTGSHPGASTAAVRATLSRHFVALGNSVCRAVRSGAPGPLGTAATRRELVSHAAAAAGPAQRTAGSLERLGAETSHRMALAPLVAAYRSLARLYRAARVPKLTAAESFSVARAIVETEQVAGGLARLLGLPSCAPAPAGP
jgi:hypothetical protein